MTGNIIGEEIDKYVADQVKFRQQISGAGYANNSISRNNKVLNFLNTRNAWVKLASGVGILEEARERIKNLISSDGYQGTGEADANGNKGFSNADIESLFGKNLAQNFILFNTIQSLKDDESFNPRRGVINNTSWNSSFNKIYGGMGYKGQGLQPVPGITGVSIECVNRGSIRKAVITLKAFNRFQFGIIETLYLRLGYIMLLEFGWDKYINNINTSTKPPTIDIENIGSTVLENNFFKNDKGGTPGDIRANIQSFRETYKGNYDGFLGKVNNFDWKLNPDMSYDITIHLITLGDVITSLKAKNPSSFTKNQLRNIQEKLLVQRYGFGFQNSAVTVKNWSTKAASLSNDKLPNIGSDKVTIDITNIELNFNDLVGKKRNFSYIPFWWFIPHVESSGGTGQLFYEYTDEDIFLDDIVAIKWNKGLKGSLTGNNYILDKGVIRKLKGLYYIRLGEFLNNFIQTVNLYSSNGNSKSPDPELLFEEDIENTICNYELNLIPLDPTVCIFKPALSKAFITKLYKTDDMTDPKISSINGLNTKLHKFATQKNEVWIGQLMNLYISTDFILKELNNNIDNKGNLSIFQFLKNLCDGINNAMAGVTNIEPVLKNDTTITFIEQNTPKGYPRIPAKGEPPKIPDVQFELLGYNPDSGNSGFVKDFGFVTKITPDLGNMISIGAAAVGSSTKTINALPFNEWNKGLVNRYKEKYVPVITEDIPPLVEEEEAVAENFIANASIQDPGSGFMIKWNYNGKQIDWTTGQIKDVGSLSWIGVVKDNKKYYDNFPGLRAEVQSKAKIADGTLFVEGSQVNASEGVASTDYVSYLAECFGGNRTNFVSQDGNLGGEKVPPYKGKWARQNDDFIKLGKSLWRLYQSKQNQRQYENEKVVSSGTGFIPLHLQLTVDGLSGVKIYNKLNIDQKFLPANYPEALNFITMKANHKIENNVWDSSYECFSIPASTKLPSEIIYESDDELSEESAVTTREESGVEPSPKHKTVFRQIGYSDDLPTTNKYTSTGLIYFPEETPKTQIVLHHTATSPDSSNEMNGILNYWGGKTPNTKGASIDSPISTHYIIDRNGNFVQVMPENYWAYNSSPGKKNSQQIQKSQVSIELMSDGWVDKKEKSNGEVYYQRGGGKEYTSKEVARPVKLIVNKNNTNQLEFSHTTYRGKSYFVKYTDAQLLKLEEIIFNIAVEHKISIFPSFPRNAINWFNTNLEVEEGFYIKKNWVWLTGVTVGGGFYGEVSPATGVKLTRGRNEVKKWYNQMYPKTGEFGDGLNGQPGIFTHNTFNASKIDVFPQWELLVALYRVSLEKPLGQNKVSGYPGTLNTTQFS